MLELAHQGAQVMQVRAVELGWVNGVVIEVLSSFEDAPGTLIKEDPLVEQRNKVRGLAHDRNVAKVTVVAVPDRPGVARSIFDPLAEAGINVDMIVQNVGHGGATDLSFTVPRVELAAAKKTLDPVVRELGARELTTDASVAKVSIVGAGLHNAPGYAARMFGTLADAGVNIEMISTSEVRITCMIAEADLETALRALHDAFELERPEADRRRRRRPPAERPVADDAVPRAPRAVRARRLDQRRRPRVAGRRARPRSASPSPTSRPPGAVARAGTWLAPPGAALLLLRSGSDPPGSTPADAWRLAATVVAGDGRGRRGTSPACPPARSASSGPTTSSSRTGGAGSARSPACWARPTASARRDPRAVIGIGVNTDWAAADFPPDLAASMTSLREAGGGRPVDAGRAPRRLPRTARAARHGAPRRATSRAGLGRPPGDDRADRPTRDVRR